MRGLFITFEGAEGAGKSTQIKRLKEYLIDKGFPVVCTREPGGTYIGDEIRDILLDVDNQTMDHKVEALLYAASRAQLVKNIISPALTKGKVVLSDRYMDSSLAYQSYGRELPLDMILEINRWATSCLDPDLTFYLDLPAEEGLKRVANSHADRIESEDIEFHKKVEEGYRELAQMYSKRYRNIDATVEEEKVFEKIVAEADRVLVSQG